MRALARDCHNRSSNAVLPPDRPAYPNAQAAKCHCRRHALARGPLRRVADMATASRVLADPRHSQIGTITTDPLLKSMRGHRRGRDQWPAILVARNIHAEFYRRADVIGPKDALRRNGKLDLPVAWARAACSQGFDLDFHRASLMALISSPEARAIN